MDDSNKPVNQNSLIWQLTYADRDFNGDTSRLLAYRPLAVRLIQKYWSSPQKNDENSRQFQHLEQELVYSIEAAIESYRPGAPKSVAWPVEDIARALGISPVVIYQDKELPEYLNPNNAV